MPLLDDIGDHLIANSVVEGSTGWPLKKSYLPEDPDGSGVDRVIAIFEVPGVAPAQTSPTKYEYPEFQIQVRGDPDAYEDMQEKMLEVVRVLNDANIAGSISNYVYVLSNQSGALSLGRDENRRPRLAWNFRTMIALDV